MSTLVSAFHDVAASREAWPDALKALTEAAGVAGAALIISNKSTGNVEEACFSGLSAEFKSDYVKHYAALDPYSPLLDGSWKKLSECIPDPILRSSEWYNDFVLTCGVRDILGVRLVDTPDYHRHLRYSSADRPELSREARFPHRTGDGSFAESSRAQRRAFALDNWCTPRTRHRAFG